MVAMAARRTAELGIGGAGGLREDATVELGQCRRDRARRPASQDAHGDERRGGQLEPPVDHRAAASGTLAPAAGEYEQLEEEVDDALGGGIGEQPPDPLDERRRRTAQLGEHELERT